MPRRLPRIARRTHTDLCREVESELTYWPGWQIGIIPPAELPHAWRTYGPVILPRWIERCPGTRPWPMYAVGEIPVPPVVRPAGEFDIRRTLPTGEVLHASHCYDLAEHLAELGIVDDEEWNRYVAQVDRLGGKNAEGGSWYCGCEYRPASRAGED